MFFKKLLDKISPPQEISIPEEVPDPDWSNDDDIIEDYTTKFQQKIETLKTVSLQRMPSQFIVYPKTMTMDSVKSRVGEIDKAHRVAMDSLNSIPVKSIFTSGQGAFSLSQLSWFAAQGFIGWQSCAIIAQHWLVDKCCTMPGKKAVRKGYEITLNDGEDIDPKILARIRELNTKYQLNSHLERFNKFNRVFGIRVLYYKMDVPDPDDYYFKPYNPNGIPPHSYRGMVQIDPYWITPELSLESSADFGSLDFYEPTWWRVNGRRIHRSHLVVSRYSEVTDLLKPSYIYGGLPLTQLIYERVYAAERTANEAPQLAQTKRLNVYKTELTQAQTKQGNFEAKMQAMVAMRDNYGMRVVGITEDVTQLDTSLTDFDQVMKGQYGLVAAISGMQYADLFGDTPKGMNSSGDYEETNSHELYETIQTHDFDPVIAGHMERLIRSEICPEFNCAPFKTEIKWNKLDTETKKEQAESNRMEAETDEKYLNAGVVSPADVRQKLIMNPNSGYSGLDLGEIVENEFEDEPSVETSKPETE